MEIKGPGIYRFICLAVVICFCICAGISGCGSAIKEEAEPETAAAPEAELTAESTPELTPEPTAEPTAEPTPEPTAEPENPEEETKMTDTAEEFYITEITDDIFERIKGKSYKDDCPIPLEDLRYLHVLHKDIDRETHEGEMICNEYIAEDVLEILKELYEAGYPIERIKLVDEYDADDEASMEDNNSSSFNFRYISHTTRVSKHGMGMAVDINTLYNPYIKTVEGELIIEPVTAGDYTDRSKDFDYKINKDDLCYKLFTEHGFEWGGNWGNSKDYQHFEMPDSVTSEMYPELS